MFLQGSFLALLRWRESPSLGFLWASGSLLGAAIGTKLTAVVALPAFAGLLLLALSRPPHSSARSRWQALSAYALGGLLVAAPWYAVIYWFTGNPFFPMLNGVFKSAGWPPVNTRFNADLFGIGTSPGALLTLPWALTFETHKFGEALAPGAMGLSLVLLPVGALLLLLGRGPHRRALVGAAVLSTMAWGLLVQYARYLVPVLPLIVVVVAAAALHVPADPRARRLNRALLGLVLVAQFSVAPLLFWNVPERFPVRRAVGRESAEAFVSRALPGYAASRYVNRVISPGEWVIGPHFANVRFYLDPPLVSGESAGWLGFNEPSPPHELAATMVERNYAYLMINTRLPAPADAFPFTRREFLECCAIPKFSRNGVVVYRVVGTRPRSSASAPNLLNNPGFEALNAKGEVEGWGAYGHPVVGTNAPAHSGRVAVRASPVDGLTQPVKIEAGRLYVLSHVSRAEGPQQYARLQINWLTQRGEILEASIDVVPAETQWQRQTMMVTAPEGAATAVVYAAVHGDSRIWFDDFTLTQEE
jgi:hypothetical protein